MADYTNAAQQRAIQVLLRLAGHEVNGLAPGEIAKALDTQPSNITRDLHNLKEAGVVETVPNMEGRWRLGPKVVQIALAHLRHVDQTKQRYDEMVQRYSREPK